MIATITSDSYPAQVLLASPDTLHFSVNLQLSDEVYSMLEQEKLVAQEADKANAVHCPGWLSARVVPHGARGGYGLVLETDDFSVKVLGKGIPNRPGLFVELRSHFLHTHPEGPQGACEEALCWLRNQLLYDQNVRTVRSLVSFESVRLSRVDLHADWQGGWVPGWNGLNRYAIGCRYCWVSSPPVAFCRSTSNRRTTSPISCCSTWTTWKLRQSRKAACPKSSPLTLPKSTKSLLPLPCSQWLRSQWPSPMKG